MGSRVPGGCCVISQSSDGRRAAAAGRQRAVASDGVLPHGPGYVCEGRATEVT